MSYNTSDFSAVAFDTCLLPVRGYIQLRAPLHFNCPKYIVTGTLAGRRPMNRCMMQHPRVHSYVTNVTLSLSARDTAQAVFCNCLTPAASVMGGTLSLPIRILSCTCALTTF